LKITIPAAGSAAGIAATWPAGIYSLALDVARPGQSPSSTNDIPFILAPSITVSPRTLQPPAPSFEVTIEAKPQVHPSQTVVVLFDDVQVAPKLLTVPANADAPSIVTADVPGNVTGFHRVRLRVDGIDSIPVVKTGDAIDFDADQSIEVKP
jgi:hypothetical protein